MCGSQYLVAMRNKGGPYGQGFSSAVPSRMEISALLQKRSDPPPYGRHDCGWIEFVGLASCASAASSSRTIARSIHSIETTTRNFPFRRRTRPSRPAKGPDLIRTCLPALKNGYGSALHIANEDRSASISSSGRLAGLPLKLTNRITPGCARTRTLFVINILTNTYPGNKGSSTSARRRFQRCTAR